MKAPAMVNLRIINLHQCIAAIIVGLSCLGLSTFVGNYIGYDNGRLWFYKALHVAAGFALAMFFRSFRYSVPRMFLGVFIVSALWEIHEYFLVYSRAGQLVVSWLPGGVAPVVSWSDLFLDYIWNFTGVAIFLCFEALLRRAGRSCS